jgi:hypothetical protein
MKPKQRKHLKGCTMKKGHNPANMALCLFISIGKVSGTNSEDRI